MYLSIVVVCNGITVLQMVLHGMFMVWCMQCMLDVIEHFVKLLA